MNPIETIKKFLEKKMHPQQIATSFVGKNGNPIFQNLIEMAKSGNQQGIETFARNICKEKGIDFDKEFSNFVDILKQ